jgi:hypothetical protein
MLDDHPRCYDCGVTMSYYAHTESGQRAYTCPICGVTGYSAGESYPSPEARLPSPQRSSRLLALTSLLME